MSRQLHVVGADDPEAVTLSKALERDAAQGHRFVVLLGIPGAGKSELRGALRVAGFLDPIDRLQGRAQPTSVIEVTPLGTGRRLSFVDAPGELIARLHPRHRHTPLQSGDVAWLRVAAKRLAGVILVLDVARLWAPRSLDEAAQVEILHWGLALLRWLRRGGQCEEGALLPARVERDLRFGFRQVGVPVLLLLSKADRLLEVTPPGRRRALVPVAEHPVHICAQHFPGLLDGVLAHARRVHVDWSHALVTDRESELVTDPASCGVADAVGWLLDPAHRVPTLPTAWALSAWRIADCLTGRGARWRPIRRPDGDS